MKLKQHHLGDREPSGPDRRKALRHGSAIAGIALAMGLLAAPVAANAASHTYWQGTTKGGVSKSSGQATMKGARGWAVTALTFTITNTYSWQSYIASSSSSGGAVASFSHPSVTGAFSGCNWGSSANN